MRRDETIERYIAEHIDAEDGYLYNLYRATNVELLNPQMTSGHIQGNLLKMLIRMINPENVLEIGTYTGYSAMSMASGLRKGAVIHTFEPNEEIEDFTRKWIENSPWREKIKFHIGDALQKAPELGIQFDLIFIDGNKREYKNYYCMAHRLLRENGWIIADNTLWDGHVTDSAYKDEQTEGIREFNKLVARDPRVEKVILPLRDGLTIIRKKE